VLSFIDGWVPPNLGCFSDEVLVAAASTMIGGSGLESR
jgi:hypothetical protein